MTVPSAPGLSTLMVSWGDWSRPVALGLGVVLMLVPPRRGRRKPPASA